MLKIYLCPKCYNYRMVSRKPDAICFHCGETLNQIDLSYKVYMNMTLEDRNDYKERYIKRMKTYGEQCDLSKTKISKSNEYIINNVLDTFLNNTGKIKDIGNES